MKLLSFSSWTLAACALHHHAEATFTIAGTDATTGQLGAAGSTCVDGSAGASLYAINYQPTPGYGLFLIQASPPAPGSDVSNAIIQTADEMFRETKAPEDILAAVSDSTMDPGLDVFEFPYNELRQYAAVDLTGGAAGYTGASIMDSYFAYGMNFSTVQTYVNEDVQGTAVNDTMVFSAQGNVISINTVPLLVEGFQAEAGCDLAERLFLAVTAVDDANTHAGADTSKSNDENFEGDVRCEYGVSQAGIPGWGFPGLQAYIHVDDAAGNEILHIDVAPDVSTSVNPYDELRAKYAEWRENNPCGSFPGYDWRVDVSNTTTTSKASGATTLFAATGTLVLTLFVAVPLLA